ncbi:hypothetical protein POM88_032684 [Heracleum sosnowskyi]|uniref:Uncharacterized protein n=1 Tax=Heracleum sosnowskyi TaxID=360622 RepID=A0AAD8I044_9APIA|nr:hypothetical protein POM88_032684 [Heracleum sosnowskyi]
MRWNQLQESDFAIILDGTHEVWHDCPFKFYSFQLRGPLACTFRGVPAQDVRMDNELPKWNHYVHFFKDNIYADLMQNYISAGYIFSHQLKNRTRNIETEACVRGQI